MVAHSNVSLPGDLYGCSLDQFRNSRNAAGCLMQSNHPASPLLIDRLEAARLLGVAPGTIDNLRIRGELPSVKIAARRLYDIADIRRFVESRKVVRQ